MTPVEAAAHAAAAAGLSVVPPVEDGTKRPDAAWKRYQSERADAAQLNAWYAVQHHRGLGAVCGKVSGNLECFEIENEQTEADLIALAEAGGLGPLVRYVVEGYAERTPGGGVHWLYRCEDVSGNTKLARRVNADGEIEVLIETRGEGGFVILAPSNGTVHPSGDAYRLESGGFDKIATISVKARYELHRMARAFDEMPKEEPTPPRDPTAAAGDGLRPGDDFNAKTDWTTLLEPEGWVHVYQRGDVSYWRRPGKDVGISATTNYGGSDLLWVFSTSTPFQAERSYDRFGAYAALKHGGDLAAAGKALKGEGYGEATVAYTLTIGQGATPGAKEAAEFLPPPASAFHGWVGRYCDLVNPTTEAPAAFQLGVALATVGAILGRHVSVRYASGPLYANLYAVLVGKSNKTRKDTAIKRAIHALTEATGQGTTIVNHGITVTRDVGSSVALINELNKNPNVLLYITELSRLIGNARRKGTETIVPTLMEAFDTPTVIHNRSMANQIEARYPYLSMLAAVQPEILANLMTGDDMLSGFANRLFFVCGSPTEPKPDPPEMDWPALTALVGDLWRARQGYQEGSRLALSDEAAARWRDWYVGDWQAEGSTAEEDALKQRHHVFIQKLALVYAVCDREAAISVANLDRSIEVVGWMWRNLSQLTGLWGRSTDGQIEEKIVAVLAQRGAMRRRVLQGWCRSRRWGAIEFSRVFDAMVKNQQIVVDANGVVGLGTDE